MSLSGSSGYEKNTTASLTAVTARSKARLSVSPIWATRPIRRSPNYSGGSTIPVNRGDFIWGRDSSAKLLSVSEGIANIDNHGNNCATSHSDAGREVLFPGDNRRSRDYVEAYQNDAFGRGLRQCIPEEKWDKHLPDWYRGSPTLVKDEWGRERCVACQLCEFICPPRAITIHPESIPPSERWGKVEKRPHEFEIDMIRCIYCGLCEEVCPEQAIFLRKDYSTTGYTRDEMVHDKARLYELGGVMTGLVNKWNDKK